MKNDGNVSAPADLAERVQALAPWFHNVRLPGGIQTAPEHALGDFPRFKWQHIASQLPDDMTGMHVLDIGCNGGFYSLEMARRGASVVAMDLDPRYLEQTRLVMEAHGLGGHVETRWAQVYDLATWEESFDVVLFLGVFYHLRYPTLGLDVVAQRVAPEGTMWFQTLMVGDPDAPEVPDAPDAVTFADLQRLRDDGWPRMSFVEGRLMGDQTNWWVPDAAAIAGLLRSAGLRIEQRRSDFWAARPQADTSAAQGWNRSEYLAALGQPWQGHESKKIGKRTSRTLETGPGGIPLQGTR